MGLAQPSRICGLPTLRHGHCVEYVTVPSRHSSMLQSAGFCSIPAIRCGSLSTSPQDTNAVRDRSGFRVVVVEDNYDANAALSKLLEKSGFQVAGRAYDGLSGLRVIKSTKPDAAILDIAMPALDGFGLARRIRSEVDSPTRLVALTGFGQESDRTEAASAGFDAYFRKPADWAELESLLREYASESSQNAGVESGEPDHPLP